MLAAALGPAGQCRARPCWRRGAAPAGSGAFREHPLLRCGRTREYEARAPARGAQALVKAELLNCIREEQDRSIVKKVGARGACLAAPHARAARLPAAAELQSCS